MRTSVTVTIDNPMQYKKQLLYWSQQFREVIFLDSNQYPQQYSSYDAVLAVDAFTAIQTDYHNAFEDLKTYQQTTKDWIFGYLSYDLKNDVEDLKSENFDGLNFPDLYFFQPKKIFLLQGNQLEVVYLNMCDDEVEEDLLEIKNIKEKGAKDKTELTIQQRISKEDYLTKVQKMLEHIHRGDIYEANFCMEFFVAQAQIEPMAVYQHLNAISEPPFAVFFKNHKQFIVSASPERYLRKEGEKIISQPIKGTAKRAEDKKEDEAMKAALVLNEKESSENIMITDLVRNDLSRTAQKGSVQVEELCGAYTFKQVHHLISTIVSKAEAEFSPVDIIKTTFPMGSMTGAPKISAMQIIENLEETQRGIYSGAVGYFSPQGDFDFNVIIRSILYSQEEQYISFSVGSAITAASIPEKEYEECLLKAKAMHQVLTQ
ncbi:anthranilate synthase component I family protein [Flavobacterium sp. '19STA2R22 D10 B1']|uniref:anthranilate synthase component I family protein n=1 Tax=Flavobacterium aerium TaxID=3037261 RepID=UPI00278C3897|nr:anthranilate synthase component I family protein [Flavobacterium sp. '19STA2R22 D10 B1']